MTYAWNNNNGGEIAPTGKWQRPSARVLKFIGKYPRHRKANGLGTASGLLVPPRRKCLLKIRNQARLPRLTGGQEQHNILGFAGFWTVFKPKEGRPGRDVRTVKTVRPHCWCNWPKALKNYKPIRLKCRKHYTLRVRLGMASVTAACRPTRAEINPPCPK